MTRLRVKEPSEQPDKVGDCIKSHLCSAPFEYALVRSELLDAHPVWRPCVRQTAARAMQRYCTTNTVEFIIMFFVCTLSARFAGWKIRQWKRGKRIAARTHALCAHRVTMHAHVHVVKRVHNLRVHIVVVAVVQQHQHQRAEYARHINRRQQRCIGKMYAITALLQLCRLPKLLFRCNGHRPITR